MILMNTINTKSAFVGQAIYCESIYPITVGNHIIIPKGSSIAWHRDAGDSPRTRQRPRPAWPAVR